VTFATPLPSKTYQATGSVSAGNFNMIGSTATVEGPLSGNVFGKVAIFEQHLDGYYENTTNEGTYVPAPGNPSGLEPQHATGLVSGTQTIVVKPTFLIEVNDDLKLKVFGQFESDIDGGSAPQQVNPNPLLGPPYKYQTVWGYTPTPENYTTNLATPGFTHIQEEHLIGEADWSIGYGVWTTIAAVRNVNFNSTYDNSGTPFNIFLVYTKEENRQVSLESRYSATVSDRISFLGGTYLFDDNLPVTVVDATNLAELGKKLADPNDPNSAANMDNQLIQYNQKTKSAAIFGNVDYKLLSSLTLSAGLRYQYENKEMDIQPGANAAGVVYCTTGTLTGCPTTFYDPSKTWYTATPRGVLAWQATQDLMTYASYSKGWGAGNFNGSPSTLGAAITPANPETVDSYEVGLKSEWFDHHFRANFAVYDENFDNIQRTAITSVNGAHASTLLNAATAKIKGVEAELTALPFDGMKVFATGGYVNAVYDEFTPSLTLPAAPYNPAGALNPTDLGFANLPRWTTDGGYSYTFGLPNVEGSFQINTDYSWRSKQFGDFANSPQDIIKSYGLLNASINHTSGPWTVSVWGRNLQNTVYDEAGAISAGWQLFPGIPRTFGVTATLKFY
jgi:iron complex outermembrane recepter protein